MNRRDRKNKLSLQDKARAYRAPRLVPLGKGTRVIRGTRSSGYHDKYGDFYL
jgi:hypothetical protein